MSVLIKGMEMPTSCRACMYSRTDIRNVDWCVLTEKDLPCDCPLIEIPPHGRLIDADALLQEHERIVDSWGLAHIVSAQAVRNAPTIIEAEECE